MALSRPSRQPVTPAVSPLIPFKVNVKDKILSISLFIALLVGCSVSKNSPSFIPTQEITPFMMPPTWTATLRYTPTVVETFTPVLPITNSNPVTTAQILSTQTPVVPAEILPIQTSTLVDLENLPKLSDVIISPIEIKNNDELVWNPLILATNTTNELQDSCLWDCVKYGYSLEEGTLTLILLRAGNHQKAENTVQNLRKEFLKTSSDAYEYTVNTFPNMPPNSWALVDSPSSTKDTRTGAASVAYGSVVILATYSQVFCEYTPQVGRYCEGDIGQLVDLSVYFLNWQIQKLNAAGYPN